MPFYREATKLDFEKEEKTFDQMPLEVKMMIQSEKSVRGCTQKYRDITGRSIRDCRDECQRYLTYINAYDDFNNGVVLYTKY